MTPYLFLVTLGAGLGAVALVAFFVLLGAVRAGRVDR